MKLLTGLIVSVMMLAAAETQATKDAAPKAKEIPAGAAQTADGSYRYTDRQGKKWLYRKTPFGVVRVEDAPADAGAKAAERKSYDDVKATVDGDTVRFERPGPFGMYKWQRKTTELNEMEQAVVDRQRARTAGKQD